MIFVTNYQDKNLAVLYIALRTIVFFFFRCQPTRLIGFGTQSSSHSSALFWATDYFWLLIPRRLDCCLPVCWPPLLMSRVMLYRLHVNSLLRERQVVALVDRFDVGRKGK